MSLFDTHVVVDWSARSKPSPKRRTRDAIYWCTVTGGAVDFALNQEVVQWWILGSGGGYAVSRGLAKSKP